jgi:hypothetical protein
VFLGLTPQANHLSPLRGSHDAIEDRSTNSMKGRFCAPEVHPGEMLDVCDGAPEGATGI